MAAFNSMRQVTANVASVATPTDLGRGLTSCIKPNSDRKDASENKRRVPVLKLMRGMKLVTKPATNSVIKYAMPDIDRIWRENLKSLLAVATVISL